MTTFNSTQAAPATSDEKQPPAVDALIDGLDRLMRQTAETKSFMEVKSVDTQE